MSYSTDVVSILSHYFWFVVNDMLTDISWIAYLLKKCRYEDSWRLTDWL